MRYSSNIFLLDVLYVYGVVKYFACDSLQFKYCFKYFGEF